MLPCHDRLQAGFAWKIVQTVCVYNVKRIAVQCLNYQLGKNNNCFLLFFREAPVKDRDTAYTVMVRSNDGTGFQDIAPCRDCTFTVSLSLQWTPSGWMMQSIMQVLTGHNREVAYNFSGPDQREFTVSDEVPIAMHIYTAVSIHLWLRTRIQTHIQRWVRKVNPYPGKPYTTESG